MAHKVNPDFFKELQKYGAGDINDCFNCGNCTAVCNLTDANAAFPRSMIRRIQLGMEDNLIEAPEPWLCYYCGECTDTCPRQAGPGETMATVRRFAVSKYDPTGLAGLMYRSPAATMIVTLVISIILTLFLIGSEESGSGPDWIFELVPYGAVHTLGLIISVLLGIVLVAGFVNIARHFLSGVGGVGFLVKRKPAQWRKAAVNVFCEIITMKRHGECQKDTEIDKPKILRQRFVHWCIMWGFFGLFAATVLDYIFIYLMGWEIFIPARILGTIAGIVMLYGVVVAIIKRFLGKETCSKSSFMADWWLLWMLFALTITGFWLEVAVTVEASNVVNDIVLLLHTVLAMDLIILLALTKIAHMVYRPVALLFYYLKS
ncbi:MAG: 4Fe-4S dicluster domain-containing protein [Verrucomicrobia bacterium]|nr:4Fe-4S dicluster domain-containing protein [Verrucomicrobiota bacterium]MCF7708606.1 4Fe-4S dicluster domain-containing protein [Verrucomicrobiota bacterium]